MKSETKLTLIKAIHTLIWVFFNFVIFYMLYAAIANKLNIWLWIGYGFVFLEGLILLAFKSHKAPGSTLKEELLRLTMSSHREHI
jgi:hypothetical protein